MKNLYGDVVEVVSRYVPLTKQDDGSLKGQCPFCGNDSLCVSDKHELFYCKRCVAGGNAPKFLALMEKINYLEACERLGISVTDKDKNPNPKEFLWWIGFVAQSKMPVETRLEMIQAMLGVLRS